MMCKDREQKTGNVSPLPIHTSECTHFDILHCLLQLRSLKRQAKDEENDGNIDCGYHLPSRRLRRYNQQADVSQWSWSCWTHACGRGAGAEISVVHM